MIGVDDLTEICPDLHETIGELDSSLRGYDSILEYRHSLSLFFEDSESGSSGSWIYAEDYHGIII